MREQTISLTDGRTLLVRDGTPADRDALVELYRDLAPEDRRARFFTAAPSKRFAETWSRVAERGGALVVAALADEPGRLIADAGYVPLPNGDAEFGVTIAKPWRGWLGPYLFDLLLDEAAAHGIPNLEGVILVTNANMLAVARARGWAVLEHPDPATMRVLVGTTGRTPSWPDVHDRPRVLVEGAGAGSRIGDVLRADGLETISCPGPPKDRPERCPLVRGERCPLVDGADAVLLARSSSDDDPVVVAYRDRDDLPRCASVGSAADRDVIATVRSLLRSRRT